MSEIALFSFGRKSSQRCPNKMLRPFAGTSLTDILLDKFAKLERPAFFGGHEPEFADRCQAHGVTFVERSQHSVSIDEPITEILAFLREIDHTHLLLVNGCLPFLSRASINDFIENCETHGREPAFGVIRRNTHFVRTDGQAVNFPSSLKTINTKTVEPLLEFAHALYFFEKDFFFNNGRYWDWDKVRYVEMPNTRELVDIDTEEDFRFAEALWRSGDLVAR